MKMRLALRAVFCVLLLCGVLQSSHEAAADEPQIVLLDIFELNENIYEIQVRTKTSSSLIDVNSISFPDCQKTGTSSKVTTSNLATAYKCSDTHEPLVLSINPEVQLSNTFLVARIKEISGRTAIITSATGEHTLLISRDNSRSAGTLKYISIGFEHILSGKDHLLFVLCICLIARTSKRVLLALSGFTLAHSFSLAAATLHWVSFPSYIVEAAIALSIAFIAAELLRKRRDTLTWQHPVWVASAFGVLHGLGFANVLLDIELPKTDFILSLLFFNTGVELGQIAFVLLIFLSAWMVQYFMKAIRTRSFSVRRTEHVSDFLAQKLIYKPIAYLSGSISAFWFLERAYF